MGQKRNKALGKGEKVAEERKKISGHPKSPAVGWEIRKRSFIQVDGENRGLLKNTCATANL